MGKLLVIGSMNMDFVVETENMPKSGETISGKSVTLIPGGKGANQAYALGALGGNVSMIGAVGKDDNGGILKKNLARIGVDVDGILELSEEVTGQAFITVDLQGDNTIIVIPGTNGLVTREIIDAKKDILMGCDTILMQLEIPLDTVMYAKELAMNAGKTIIVDPAPARTDIPDSFWKGIDYIKPNQTELATLVGHQLENTKDVKAAAHEMLKKGVKGVIVTLGEDGCYLVTKEEEKFFEAEKVIAIDTTAAGDSFTAGFALYISQGKSSDQAIKFAQKVSAIAVTRKGAQTSVPTIDEVMSYGVQKEECNG